MQNDTLAEAVEVPFRTISDFLFTRDYQTLCRNQILLAAATVKLLVDDSTEKLKSSKYKGREPSECGPWPDRFGSHAHGNFTRCPNETSHDI